MNLILCLQVLVVIFLLLILVESLRDGSFTLTTTKDKAPDFMFHDHTDLSLAANQIGSTYAYDGDTNPHTLDLRQM